MLQGTSPAIAGLTNGGYEAAYQSASGTLAILGSIGNGDTGNLMAPATSPAIAGLTGGGWEAAFQSKGSPLTVTNNAGLTNNTGQGCSPEPARASRGSRTAATRPRWRRTRG